MIEYCLLIWLGVKIGMPAGYFIVCGLGMGLKFVLSLIKTAIDNA